MKKLYTGAYLLKYKDAESQFGIVDASSTPKGENTIVRICLGKKIADRILKSDNDTTIDLTLEESEILYKTLIAASSSIEQLINLSLKNKLNDNAFIETDI